MKVSDWFPDLTILFPAAALTRSAEVDVGDLVLGLGAIPTPERPDPTIPSVPSS